MSIPAPEPYSEEWWDEVYDFKDMIWNKVTAVVDEMTASLDPVMDREIRTMLTEEYRFWRN